MYLPLFIGGLLNASCIKSVAQTVPDMKKCIGLFNLMQLEDGRPRLCTRAAEGLQPALVATRLSDSGFVSPPGLPILRHLLVVSSELGMIPNLLDISRKYGGRIKLDFIYGVPVLFISDKDLVSYICNTKPLLTKETYGTTDKWIGEGLLTCKAADRWKTTRKMLNPCFSLQQLEIYLESFEDPTRVLVEELKAEVGKKGFDVLPYLSACALDIICEAVMGIRLNVQGDENSQYMKDIHEMCSIIIRQKEVVGRIRRLTQDVIDNRRKEKTASSSPISDSNKKNKNASLLDVLLDAEIDGRRLTDRELLDETQSFLFAGHHTSATCISLCLYCLSKHLDVQNKVVKELDSIFGSDNRFPTWNDLNEMRYLEMVIKETMRFYTVTPFISRLVDEDVSFGDIFIPKGMHAMIFVYGIHMNAEYHPNPERFDPSRFEKEMTSYTFIPFGAGPRNCLGQRFAMLEIKYVLSQVLRNFNILEVVDHIPQRVMAVLLRFKNGMMIRLEPK
ncbi:hypothetical protein Trydic_g14464 [Trypoxylus dichotomus]